MKGKARLGQCRWVQVRGRGRRCKCDGKFARSSRCR